MSQNGYLVCTRCEVYLALGQYVRESDRPYFHSGVPGGPPNSAQRELTSAVWRFLAEHASHDIRVMLSGDPEFESLGDIAEIGGDRPLKDITFEDYLRDWQG